MKARRTISVAISEPALVLYWPTADGGLWNREASLMVEGLEDRLEVFVTCVGAGRGALALTDVGVTARFMGCSSVVVISPQGCHPPAVELDALSSELGSPVVAVRAAWTARAVADVYREACRLIDRAA